MRRLLLVMMLVTVAACGLSGGDDAGSGEAAGAECEPGVADGDLNLYNWSEYIDPELITQFEEELGVSVTETFYDSNETMLAQIDAGGAAYDLVVPSDYMVQQMIEAELLIPLNPDALSNLGNIDPEFTGLPFDPDGTYSVPYQWGTTGLGFPLEMVPDPSQLSWGLIFDPEMSEPFAGKIQLLNDERETLGAALKYLGYSLNSTSEEEINEAAELIRGAKDRIATFDSDAYDDLLISGETLLGHGFNGNWFSAFDAADAWETFGYGVPIEGGTAWVDNMAIPTTAESVCTAHAFIDFILDAENGAALTNFNFYASPNAASVEFILPEILEDPAIFPPEDVMANLEFISGVGDAATLYADAFTAVKS
jgi:spermidine/putrescine-binding protein